MKPYQKGSAERLTFIELIILLVSTAILGTIFLSVVYAGRRPEPTAPRLPRFEDPKKGGLIFRSPDFDYHATFPTAVPMANGGTPELAGIVMAGAPFLVISSEWSTPNILFRPVEFDPAGNWIDSFGSTGAGGEAPFTNR